VLPDYRGKPLVLIFYPLDWSPTYCDQLSPYQSELEAFQQRDAVAGDLGRQPLQPRRLAAVRGLSFPLLADFEPKGAVARQYQVYHEEDGFSERAHSPSG
jgi:peroxiredoxin